MVWNVMIEDLVRGALCEDLGRGGDITSAATLPENPIVVADIVARRPGVVSGIAPCSLAFSLCDRTIVIDEKKTDGARVEAGDVILRLQGPARSLLAAERVGLNFLGHLSGIATVTAACVARIDGYGKARIAATRKTTPGLRALEKAAVQAGGGTSHRYGLDDAVLIKDNHIALGGSITQLVARARARVGHLVKIEVEVDTLDQVLEAVSTSADALLLDNMSVPEVKDALARLTRPMITEASGGITLETVRDYAQTGVDILSLGWLTHSAPCLDIGLDIVTGI